jgi:transcriptional regulator with XRE-family HTH domain
VTNRRDQAIGAPGTRGDGPAPGTLGWRLNAYLSAKRKPSTTPGVPGSPYSNAEIAREINKRFSDEQKTTLRSRLQAEGTTPAEIERQVQDLGDQTVIDPAYISALRNGTRDNPSVEKLSWLAWWCGVLVEQLVPVTAEQEKLAREADEQVDALLHLQRQMEKTGGQLAMLFRRAGDLDAGQISALLTIVEGLEASKRNRGS